MTILRLFSQILAVKYFSQIEKRCKALTLNWSIIRLIMEIRSCRWLISVDRQWIDLKGAFHLYRNMMVLRVHGDDLMFGGGSGVITHSPRIPQMEMMKVHIPFTFKLHESFKSTYAGKSSTLRLSSIRRSSSINHVWLANWLVARSVI